MVYISRLFITFIIALMLFGCASFYVNPYFESTGYKAVAINPIKFLKGERYRMREYATGYRIYSAINQATANKSALTLCRRSGEPYCVLSWSGNNYIGSNEVQKFKQQNPLLVKKQTCKRSSPKGKFQCGLVDRLGESEEQLVRRYGVPTSNYQTGRTKILTYLWNQGSSYTTSNNNWARNICQHQYCPDIPYREYTVQNTWYCEWTFTIVDGIVQDWSYKGNNCY